MDSISNKAKLKLLFLIKMKYKHYRRYEKISCIFIMFYILFYLIVSL
jgi:hypothetical protein